MTNNNTTDLKSIESDVPDNVAFLCCASYEERCKSIALALDKSKVNSAFVFYDSKYVLTSVASEISGCFSNAEIKQMNLSNPIEVADVFAKTVENIQNREIENIIIDITTFTHESLLILLKILHSFKNVFKKIGCLYTGAGSYGGVSTPPEQKWLSKGCKDVRNVLGYPGILRPAAKTCLIILAGFELERAARLIELLEPDRIAIGNGLDPTNDAISDTMAYFRNKFNEWEKEYKNRICESFDFSCKNIISTVESINSLINSNPNDNYILIPLNTKLSTIASALAALQNPKIQVCYSIPEIYNIENYSTSSDKITFFELSDMIPFK